MAREGRSHVRKRKKGCLVGCLTNLMLLLGVIVLLNKTTEEKKDGDSKADKQ